VDIVTLYFDPIGPYVWLAARPAIDRIEGNSNWRRQPRRQ
jgi:hypothetical protein